MGITGNEKADAAVKSALEFPHAKVGVPYNNLNIASANISFPLGTVRSRISFILSSRSWEIGSSPTGSIGRMNLFCVVPALVIHI